MKFLQKFLCFFKPCPSETSDAVLHILHPIFLYMPSDMTVWCNDYDNATAKKINDYQKEIVRVRAWAQGASLSCCVFKEYNRWLDFYQNRLDEAIHEFRTQDRKKSHDVFKRKEAMKEFKMDGYLKQNPIPTPPR